MDKTTVGNLCKPYIGQLKLDDNTLIDYFDIASVDNIEKQITGYTTYKFAEAPSRARKKVEKGNILVSTVRPNLNAVALFDEETENMPVASTGFCVLECKANTSPRFLFRYLQSQSFVRAMVSQATGASYPAVSDKIVRDTKLPAYSYEEQIQIANVLDATANIISKRKHQLQKLDELVKARFVEMFGDPVRNSMGLPTEPMTTVCAIIDGDRGKNYPKQDEFSDTGYCLFLNAKNVTATGFSFESRMFITKEKDNALHNGKLERGDVVLTTRGTLGNLAFYDDSVPFENVRINSGMVILRMNKSVMTEVFFIEQFKLQLQSIKGKIASGSAQPQLPISTMNKIRILLAPMTLQEQFATFVEQTDKSKAAVQKALDEAQLLFDSLMQKYFE